MTRRLLLSYLAVTALALAMLAIPLGVTNAHSEKEKLLFDIERDANAMTGVVEGAIQTRDSTPRADLTAYAARTGGHVVVVDLHGLAILDTDHPKAPGRDYSTRPEIQAALHGRQVEGTRPSETLETTLLYAAVPVTNDGRVIGAVRITYPTATLDRRVRQMWARLGLLCGGVLLAAAAAGFALARSVTRPVRNLERVTDRLAEGDLAARVEEPLGPPELRHLAGTFNRMADRLGTLVDVQHRFVADASHQLRTPLTALRLRLENLETSVSADVRSRIDAATEEVTRMSRLVDELLMLAHGAEAHEAPVPIDIAPIVRRRGAMWNEVAAERGVHVSVESPESATAAVVPGAVEQVVDNLVDNALAVSPAGATIEVRVTPTDRYVDLHVLDEGPGLDPAERAQAFDRFWRAATAVPGGSGLGLAIVRELVEAGGGSTWLDARAGTGVDAVVRLPRAADNRLPGDLTFC